METKALIVTEPVFNSEVLHGGVAIRLKGATADGADITGNYIICANTGGSLTLTGHSFGQVQSIRLDIEDIEHGLTLEILAGVEEDEEEE